MIGNPSMTSLIFCMGRYGERVWETLGNKMDIRRWQNNNNPYGTLFIVIVYFLRLRPEGQCGCSILVQQMAAQKHNCQSRHATWLRYCPSLYQRRWSKDYLKLTKWSILLYNLYDVWEFFIASSLLVSGD